MITCELGEKKYSVKFITGRAMREIQPALKMYAKISDATRKTLEGENVEDETTIQDALDVLVEWFCLLFGNQFTPDEMYDGYPVDRLVHDVVLALLAVEQQTTEVLDHFPTTPAMAMENTKKKKD